MKIRTLLATGLIGIGVVGLFGHGLAVDKHTAPQPEPSVRWQQERAQLAAGHKNDVTMLMANLHQYEMRVDTLEESNTNLAIQRLAACQRLSKAGITIPECR